MMITFLRIFMNFQSEKADDDFHIFFCQALIEREITNTLRNILKKNVHT